MSVKHIFIVEDDAFFAKIFTRRVENIGNFKVHHYLNCESALEELLTYKPKVVFLDHFLTGLNGVDALPLVKENLPETQVVIISGQNDTELLDQALNKGASEYFRKDVLIMKNTEEFLAHLEDDISAVKKFFNGLLGH